LGPPLDWLDPAAKNGAPMSKRMNNTIAWTGAAALLALHLDFWRDRGTALLMGWLPQELAWRAGWMLLSTLYLVWFCRSVWVEED
jgi:hypothetical protein